VLNLVSDENFNGDILRGLYRRRPDLFGRDVNVIGAKFPAEIVIERPDPLW
jgi:hypothetical protein